MFVSKSCEMFHLLTILTFFNLVSGSCCHKVKAWYEVKNNAWSNSDYFGDYTMQAGFVNGKAHFLKDDDKTCAIWFSDTKQAWVVGETSELGSDNGTFFAHVQVDCPHQFDFAWRYSDQYDSWHHAKEGFSIWCES